MSREGAWSLTILVASGALEPPYPTNLHLNIGGKKGDERTSGDDLFIKDGRTYEQFYGLLEDAVAGELNLTVDHQKYHNTNSSRHFLRKLNFRHDANHMVMRIEWKQLLWSQRRLLLARIIAERLYRAVIGTELPPLPPELKTKAIGYDGYPSLEQPG